VIAALRDVAPGPGPDRYLAPEIDATVELVRGGAVRRAAEAVAGPLPS
jgi:histidine ammonia-lyase